MFVSVVRAWNLLVLAGAFLALAFVLWHILVLPWDHDPRLILRLNQIPISFFWLFRLIATVHLILTFLYFRAHCVVANREESTRIVTRG